MQTFNWVFKNQPKASGILTQQSRYKKQKAICKRTKKVSNRGIKVVVWLINYIYRFISIKVYFIFRQKQPYPFAQILAGLCEKMEGLSQRRHFHPRHQWWTKLHQDSSRGIHLSAIIKYLKGGWIREANPCINWNIFWYTISMFYVNNMSFNEWHMTYKQDCIILT